MMRRDLTPTVFVLMLLVGGPSMAPAQNQPEPPRQPAGEVAISVLPQAEIGPKLGDDVRVKQIGFVKGLRYVLPVNWTPETPDNPMRLVQIRIPPLANELHGDGTLVISAGIGGSVDDNIARWVAQFTEVEGVPTQQDLQITGSPLLVTQVIATGTYNAGMPGAEPVLQPNTTMWGAIVQGGPEGVVFIKAVGPKETMQERHVAWEVFVRNLVVMKKPRVLRKPPGRYPESEEGTPPSDAPEQPKEE
ncbi:MAG: hypothetical protein JNK58_04655 [Phycisphaerae bacterium]|nr:hypothetical protein [Phycisphaerae bacterium]